MWGRRAAPQAPPTAAHRPATTAARATGGNRGGGDPNAPPPPPAISSFQLTLVAGAASAAFAALFLAGGDAAPLDFPSADEAGGAGGLFSPASPARPGFLLATALWTGALRLVSIPQLAFLFLGRVDGDRPVDGVERYLSLAAGPDGPTTPGQLTAVRAGATTLFAAGGLAVATALGAALGDDIWAVATGLGALAAGGLMEAGRPTALSPAEAAAASARLAAFAAWADGGALARGGQCHESEVVRAAKALGGPAAVPPRWSEEEVKAALRAWAADGGGASAAARSPPSRSASGYWKGVSVVRKG